MNETLDLAVIFLPLLGAALAGLGGHRLGDRFARIVTCVPVCLAALLSVFVLREVAFEGAARTHVLGAWIDMPGLVSHWAVRFDTLSAVMVATVLFISAMVHLYSLAYMAHDKGVPRFMAELSLFTFFMLTLVSANDMLQMFFGWEGVGLSSYLLIGFWFDRPRACAAAIKAFLVNRVGDFGFLLGLLACVQGVGSLDLDHIFKNVPQLAAQSYVLGGFSCNALTTIALLFFIGAMGKSAQIGLHIWLPDAMEGPTPVSALIHAATMVTAGVFLLARLSPLFEQAPDAQAFVAIIGAVTAVFAASIALTQFDIKRVIAYSTMSQLGYMVFAAGVSAYGASIFHLVTHAFFKALLFLAAGSVIHAMGGEQDMRRMGGLAKKMPVTYGLMLVGALSLAGIGVDGVFGFAGFYSKDMILNAAYARGAWFGNLAFALGLIGAFMTAFYICRLLILTFHGQEADVSGQIAQVHKTAKESSWLFLAPMMPLAFGAIFAGWAGHHIVGDPDFWRGALFVRPETAALLAKPAPWFVRFAPLVMALLGLGSSVWLYLKRPDMHEKLVARLGPVHRAAAHQFYFDEIYNLLFVRPARRLGRLLHLKVGFFDDLYDFLFVRIVQRIGDALWRKGDDALIDRLGPDGAARLAQAIGRGASRAQTGFLPHYAFAMAFGLALLAGWALAR